MQRRIHLKRRKHYNNRRIVLFRIFLVGLILSIMVVFMIGKKLNFYLMNYAKVEARKFATTIINKSINDAVSKKLEIDSLFNVVKNNSGDIQTIDFDPMVVNVVLREVVETIEVNLKNIEDGNLDNLDLSSYLSEGKIKKLKDGVICELPLGILTNNSLLANLGPSIPIRLQLIGEVTASINTKINNYGINNALVEVYATISLTESIILPLYARPIDIMVDIPLALKIIPGKVPSYYQNGIDRNSSMFSLPIN